MKASVESVRCKKSPPAWHAAFEAMIPVIESHAKIAFRHLNPEAREEAVQETVCNACKAYARLVELGKTDIAYASVLARFGVSQTKDGRKVGGRLNVRDATSAYCQQREHVVVEPLDKYDTEEDSWLEVLVEDRRAGPADIAASRGTCAEMAASGIEGVKRSAWSGVRLHFEWRFSIVAMNIMSKKAARRRRTSARNDPPVFTLPDMFWARWPVKLRA
jgi:hypothetical protein